MTKYYKRTAETEPIPAHIGEDIIFRKNYTLLLLKEIVEECGFTYQELADAFHCSLGTIYRYMNFDPSVTVKPEVIRFVLWFGKCQYDDLFDVDDVEV